jgi:hypothetical protein
VRRAVAHGPASHAALTSSCSVLTVLVNHCCRFGICAVQVRLESDKAAMQQKEAEAASAAQERDTLRNKLKVLQDQILRGDQATARAAALHKVRQQQPAPCTMAMGLHGVQAECFTCMLRMSCQQGLSTPCEPYVMPLVSPMCCAGNAHSQQLNVLPVCTLMLLFSVCAQLRGSVDSHGLFWHNRAALAKELRASAAGVLLSQAATGLAPVLAHGVASALQRVREREGSQSCWHKVAVAVPLP